MLVQRIQGHAVGNKKGVLARQRHPKSADWFMGLAGVGNCSLRIDSISNY